MRTSVRLVHGGRWSRSVTGSSPIQPPAVDGVAVQDCCTAPGRGRLLKKCRASVRGGRSPAEIACVRPAASHHIRSRPCHLRVASRLTALCCPAALVAVAGSAWSISGPSLLVDASSGKWDQMQGLDVNTFTAQIDKLLGQYQILRGQSKYDDLSDLEYALDGYIVRLRAGIERLAPNPSTYIEEMKATADDRESSTTLKLSVYRGILSALRADITEGWLERVAELLHADTFADFIGQSMELHGKGYDNAAAVVAGSALEAHIRLLCQKHGISTASPSGQHTSADRMNAELVKASAYNALQQKAVASWQAIRNAAAHGEYDKYTKEQVVNMINSVRDFMLRYPA
jgi:hypothetical protein